MTIDECRDMAEQHGKTACTQFIDDMRSAGIPLRWYRGRNYWAGPAADVDDIADVLQETKVKCQWDQMGRGYIVYPRENMNDLTKE